MWIWTLWKKKNQISDFYFYSYGHFCDVSHHPNFRWIFTKTWKTKIKYFFSFFILFSTFYISLKNLTISEGGVCIKLVGTADLIKFILVYFLSILSTKSTISHKLKIGKLFSPRCNDFFPIKDMQTFPSPPRSGQIFMKDAGLFPT